MVGQKREFAAIAIFEILFESPKDGCGFLVYLPIVGLTFG
jgi:hypothetical protein